MGLSSLHHRDLGIPGRPLIAGEFLSPAGLTPWMHVNPTTGHTQAELGLGGAKEVDQAVRVAKGAQRQWIRMSAYARMEAVPALAAGNAVVLKPPALAPFVALRIGQMIGGAGYRRSSAHDEPVKQDLKKIAKGKPMSPVLLILR